MDVSEPRGHEAVDAPTDQRKLRLLLAIINDLSSTLELQSVLQKAIEGAVELMGLQTGAIYLTDDDSLYLGATTPPLPEDFPEHLRHASIGDHPNVAGALSSGRPSLMPDANAARLTEPERQVCEARDLRTILFVPLLAQGRRLGAFIVGSQGKPQPIPEADIALCATLAFSIALAVENAQLFESVRTSAAELASAYDAELTRRERLRELAVSMVEDEAHRDAWIATELDRRVVSPMERVMRSLRTSEALKHAGRDDPRVREALSALATIERAARDLQDELTSPAVDEQGFSTPLGQLCGRHLPEAAVTRIKVDADVAPTGSPVDRLLLSAASDLLKAIGESSRATHVDLNLSMHGDDFVLTIRVDDPRLPPFLEPSARPHSLRWFSLSERAAHLGGRLEIESSDSQGTTIRLVLPSKEWDLGAT